MATTLSGSSVLNADLEIGAVELKDAGSDSRASVEAVNTARTIATVAIATQPINALGKVIGPVSVYSKANFTRPSDTTTYTAGDAVTDSTSAPTVITFDACARVNAGSGKITNVMLQDSANVATKGSFELWLFHTTVTPDNDNAVFTPTDAENRTSIGVIPFTLAYVGNATSGADGNVVYMGTVDRPLPFVCDAADDNLYGLLVVRNAYVPVSAERFDVTLFIDQD